MSLFSVETKSISSGLLGTALQLLARSNIVFKHHATNNLGAVVYFYSCMTLYLKLSSQATQLMLFLMMEHGSSCNGCSPLHVSAISQQHDSVDGSVGWWSRQKKNKSLDQLDVTFMLPTWTPMPLEATCSHLSTMQLTFCMCSQWLVMNFVTDICTWWTLKNLNSANNAKMLTFLIIRL